MASTHREQGIGVRRTTTPSFSRFWTLGPFLALGRFRLASSPMGR